MRLDIARLALPALLLLVSPTGCDSGAPKTEPKTETKSETKGAHDTKAGEAADATAKPGKAEPFAKPTAKPPPPPEGVALLEKPLLYVQRCDEEHPCPELLMPKGETHCRELELGGRDSWRLPDKEEAEAFATLKGQAEQLEGFHWTRTPDAENPELIWIIDPLGGYKTGVKRDRKPFRIRCVQEP